MTKEKKPHESKDEGIDGVQQQAAALGSLKSVTTRLKFSDVVSAPEGSFIRITDVDAPTCRSRWARIAIEVRMRSGDDGDDMEVEYENSFEEPLDARTAIGTHRVVSATATYLRDHQLQQGIETMIAELLVKMPDDPWDHIGAWASARRKADAEGPS
ncbi:hypothetical protein Pmar_PMAR013689 [Perkinsus marinus ATCC 50983]|uniref:Uncharacterized protein n=1 Tax=Perkinsus marinus (strain ATCC 50983 / TXsc) TaxID=423536 RepID=C5LY10_PERM5|nr:hypothetical protein Pmar_PMAR013689 [Perkinsus marinus ATCC 50983]EEQ98340.1 hypothetical protein Pmar_PMAR013689 [Perkinsus marinus ATCC 50983]|eukprot:XP_002765623.1 hypothetical protein Pmar_PMAR013689 [Perkinsus marinus ATCC 50983]